MGGNEEQENGHMMMEVVTVDERVNELLNYINKHIPNNYDYPANDVTVQAVRKATDSYI